MLVKTVFHYGKTSNEKEKSLDNNLLSLTVIPMLSSVSSAALTLCHFVTCIHHQY